MASQKVSKDQFMRVKQRLDYHHLPTTFPVEATPLINRLLSMIDGKPVADCSKEDTEDVKDLVSGALKHEIARLVKENNELHMNWMLAKEQIQSLQHKIYKTDSNKLSELNESSKVSAMRIQREDELVNQLREVKYKYNELMDFLHQNPTADREYIKRLIKHKQIPSTQAPADHPQESQKHSNNTNAKVKELQSKLINRQTQLIRLRKLIQYDGINMNKLIKNFTDDLAKKQLKNAQNKVNYLEESYQQVKKENANMKNKNGLKEALRAEVQKCHKTIETLKKENQDLKRNHKELDYDQQKKTFENERKIGKVQSQKSNVDKQLLKSKGTIKELNKKVQFLNKELLEAEKHRQLTEGVLNQKVEINSNILKKNEEIKLFYEYEVQTLKKKVLEFESEAEDCKGKLIAVLGELQLVRNESALKTQSILNLEKIVNELIRKNSMLADLPTGTFEQSLKQSAESQLQNRLLELERLYGTSQNEAIQLETNLRSLEHRFGQVVKDNQKFKYQNGSLKNHLSEKQTMLLTVNRQLQELNYLIRKEQAEHSRELNLANETAQTATRQMQNLKIENQRLSLQEKSAKMRVKDMEIKISEEEGVWEVSRLRLEEKENKIKQLQKLLTESVQQFKVLSNQLNELEQRNHELSRDKHRLAKKYEQLKKDQDEFKATSFKNYEAAINDNLNETSALKKELIRLSETNANVSGQYEDLANVYNLIRRQKQLIEFDKISLTRETDILRARVEELQDIERVLVLQNESLRLARGL